MRHHAQGASTQIGDRILERAIRGDGRRKRPASRPSWDPNGGACRRLRRGGGRGAAKRPGGRPPVEGEGEWLSGAPGKNLLGRAPALATRREKILGSDGHGNG